MSSWPLISDFSRMLKNPQFAFRDATLRQCVVEMDNLGQPRARSGNFATVYRGYRVDGSEFAIRVFNRRGDQRRERYQIVGEYLARHAVSTIVDFHYDEQGIRSAGDGKLYPLLTMDWVSGVTLFEWARDRCREGYQEALTIGAQAWLQLVGELIEANVVHGDLQHGNVLVDEQGHFKLVDYDCMAVPSLMNRRNLEMGLPPYQHPGRNIDTVLFPGLDNFSALLIYVALRALAADPSLWTTYVDAHDYDKVLFRTDDFADPANSPLYQSLMNSPEEQVRDLTHYLFQLAYYELHDVPPVDEVLLWCHSLDSLLAERDWDKAVQLVQRMGPDEQVPPDLQPMVDEAHRRIAAREALAAALAAGDEEQVRRCYVPELLDDYPDAADLVAQARQAEQVIAVLEVLRAAKRLSAWDMYRDTWLANQQLLARRASARPFKGEMQQLITIDNLRRMLAKPNSDDALLIETWRHLQSTGGHPAATPLEEAVQQRIARRRALLQYQDLLRTGPPEVTPEFDQKLVAAWQAELFDGWKQAAMIAQQFEAARRRIEGIAQLDELAGQCTLDAEKQQAKISQDMPDSYAPEHAERLRLARHRLAAYRKLHEAIKAPPSDRGMAEAWQELVAAQGESLVSEKVRKRIALAEQRAPALARLAALSTALPDYECDRQLLEAWDAELLDDCPDAAAWKTRYEAACQRKPVLERLDQAVADYDLRAVERLIVDPRLQGFTFHPELLQTVEQVRAELAQQQQRQLQALTTALVGSRRASFGQNFDTQLVRQIGQAAPHHQPTIVQWTESEILPLSVVGLAPHADGSLERPETDQCVARWIWPPVHLTDRCVVGVLRERPKPFTDPAQCEPLHCVAVDLLQWETDGEQLAMPIDPEWEGAHVYVWAVVDFGFTTLFSEPLDLGPIEPVRRQRRWGLFGKADR